MGQALSGDKQVVFHEEFCRSDTFQISTIFSRAKMTGFIYGLRGLGEIFLLVSGA